MVVMMMVMRMMKKMYIQTQQQTRKHTHFLYFFENVLFLTTQKLLGLFADEKSAHRLAFFGADLAKTAGNRYSAHFQPANIVSVDVLDDVEQVMGDQAGPLRVEHGRFHVKIEIALLAGGEDDFAIAERAVEDYIGQSGPLLLIGGCSAHLALRDVD